MRILLPPSETKRLGGRQQFSEQQLFQAPALRAAREHVRRALEAVSVDEEAAVRALRLGVRNRDERTRNLELLTSPAMPAVERYTGVLYDALNAAALPDRARSWVDAHIVVQSALFGVISAADTIPAYRLSASSRLPELGQPLWRLWAPAHAGLLEGVDYLLDLRSQDYAALAPLRELGATETDVLELVARGENGEVRALNHFNKAGKGDLVRRLALTAPEITTRDELLAWATAEGLEMYPGERQGTVRLVAEQ